MANFHPALPARNPNPQLHITYTIAFHTPQEQTPARSTNQPTNPTQKKNGTRPGEQREAGRTEISDFLLFGSLLLSAHLGDEYFACVIGCR
ncbi:predicted protein [Plenodomus lingam JN3]|uniref:Predicted protein n=1 Tax=Leptosphaeria maculans (strain JN3 / isolate v23.1.3 / race Av1-4-5-6-7-8) TaxID=985895 RepID=E4ZS10_LEPMJ|nr:predicted protein [Plenodomus lingam JN3]CBX94190.1 predicted protein [Plenodomus lingam JN3]